MSIALNIASVTLTLAIVATLILRTGRGHVTCCEHNVCPQRPRHLLGRFATREWICPQCHTRWRTEGMGSMDGTMWSWVPSRIVTTMEDAIPKADPSVDRSWVRHVFVRHGNQSGVLR